MHSTLPGFSVEPLGALQGVYGRLPFSSFGRTSIPAGASMPIRPSEKHMTITSPWDVLITAPSPGLRVSLSIDASLQDLIPWRVENMSHYTAKRRRDSNTTGRGEATCRFPVNDATLAGVTILSASGASKVRLDAFYPDRARRFDPAVESAGSALMQGRASG